MVVYYEHNVHVQLRLEIVFLNPHRVLSETLTKFYTPTVTPEVFIDYQLSLVIIHTPISLYSKFQNAGTSLLIT